MPLHDAKLKAAAAAASALAFAFASAGLARTILTGLAIDDDSQQWRHVVKHEQRFLQALRQGTSAEADDASC